MEKQAFDEILESEEYARVSRDIAAKMKPFTWRDRETLCRRWIDETYEAMSEALGELGAEFAFALAIGRALQFLGAEHAEDEHAARLMKASCFTKHNEAAHEFFVGAPEGAVIN